MNEGWIVTNRTKRVLRIEFPYRLSPLARLSPRGLRTLVVFVCDDVFRLIHEVIVQSARQRDFIGFDPELPQLIE